MRPSYRHQIRHATGDCAAWICCLLTMTLLTGAVSSDSAFGQEVGPQPDPARTKRTSPVRRPIWRLRSGALSFRSSASRSVSGRLSGVRNQKPESRASAPSAA